MFSIQLLHLAQLQIHWNFRLFKACTRLYLAVLRSGRLFVEMQKLMAQFLQRLQLAGWIDFENRLRQKVGHVANLVSNDVAWHRLKCG